VEAGHDRFSSDLVNYAMQRYQSQLPIEFKDLMALGRVEPKNENELFCMTVLALKLSRAANGVSELHGRVSRHMWQSLYPGKTVDQVPIGHITNGVHLLGWMKGTVRKFWRRKLNGETKHASDWDTRINSPEFWEKMSDPEFISDEELWALRY